MAGRPKKNTVDYFPHYVNHGKTIQILSTKYGNNGKAFWWTLLEILGSTENHYYDCNNSFNWEFLLSKTLLDDISATEILNTLVSLDAIDAEFWKVKVIWCQKFINNIEDVYRKRGAEIPQRPEYLLQKYGLPIISVTENTQSKVKDSKVKDSKVLSVCFEKFWEAYPKKVGKEEAKKEFIKIDPDEQDTKNLIIAFKKQVELGMISLRENNKFCPHASTWLHQKRYLDPLEKK